MTVLAAALQGIVEDILTLVSPEVARTYRALPVRMSGGSLVVAVADAEASRTLRAIQFATGQKVQALVVDGVALDAAIGHYYPAPGAAPVGQTRPAPAAVEVASESSVWADFEGSDLAEKGVPHPGEDDEDALLDSLFGDDDAEPAPARVVTPAPVAARASSPTARTVAASAPTTPLAPAAKAPSTPSTSAPRPASIPAPPTAPRPSPPGSAGSPARPAAAAGTTAVAAAGAGSSTSSTGVKVAAAEAPRPQVPAAPGLPPPIQTHEVVKPAWLDPALLDKAEDAALKLLTSDSARNFRAVPMRIAGAHLEVAFAEPPDDKALRALQYATGKLVRPTLTSREGLDAAILRFYPPRAPKAPGRVVDHPRLGPEQLADRDPDIIRLFKTEVARKHRAVPIELVGRRLTVVMADPGDLAAIQDLEFVSGKIVKAFATDLEALDLAVEKYFPPSAAVQADRILSQADMDELEAVETVDDEEESIPIHTLEEMADEAPAVKLCNLLIRQGVSRGASDIHIETYETEFRVRYRIDGVLYEVSHPPMALRNALISRIKVMSGMNIAETRMPQDGRIKLRMKDKQRVKQLDFRVSTMPTLFGERVVMRILDPDKLVLDLTKLGLDRQSLDRLDNSIRKPYGMVLVVGPSGCGKTNTLYSAMTAVNDENVNIMTAEDPVEFNITGINQVQTKEQVGLSFAVALRSFLRQDPNIILVGEIRDFETAEMAVKASLTGHLVLSTLHTTDAPTTISRLINMGVEPFLVTSSMLLVSAQRLVRLICRDCKEPETRPEADLLKFGFTADQLSSQLYRGAGCEKCLQTGYKGRTALFEVLLFTDGIKELILQGATPAELRMKARQEGMLTLRESGILKILNGETSFEEVDRETMK